MEGNWVVVVGKSVKWKWEVRSGKAREELGKGKRQD